jgi:hypothetical protein
MVKRTNCPDSSIEFEKAQNKVSSKQNGLIRGVLIGSLCGVLVGALATTLVGRALISLFLKIWNKLTRQNKEIDFRWLLQ